ncbi:MAG: ParB/RepB/Spo0J family partition protein [Xenococcaceae cyanobacterium MO_188.B19]|nr:ParB/RepB/Spo0J family partition protein [Xenococcaceae cyanobacterium MO_188.B19]
MSKKHKPYGSSLKNRVDALFNSSLEQKVVQTSITPPNTAVSLNVDVPSSYSGMIYIEQIVLPPYQPRQYFNPDSLSKLAATIKAHGIVEPLIVRLKNDSMNHDSSKQVEKSNFDQYELVAGGRRYRAAQTLGLKEVPVVILDLSDSESLELAILENIAREDLNPIEETEAILNLLSNRLNLESKSVVSLLYQMRNQIKGISNRNVSANHLMEVETVQEVFDPMGLSWKSFVETRLPLLKLPEDILEPLRQGKIEYTKAKAISSLKDEQARKELMAEAIAKSLSLREIKERIKALNPQPQKEEIFNQLDHVSKRVKKSKKLILENPRKRKKLQSLLAQIDKLLEQESS